MKCKNINCKAEANPTLGSGKFCSRSCANTRIRTKEVRLKISKGVKRTGATRPPLTGESLERWKLSIKKAYEKKYISKSFDELSVWQRRRRVIEEQNGCCAICSYKFGQKASDCYVDHCHSTKKVRGLLCQHCNMSLGGFRDKTESLKKAIAYLERNTNVHA